MRLVPSFASTLGAALFLSAIVAPAAVAACPPGSRCMGTSFEDVPVDAWYAQYVFDAQETGIVSGYADVNGNATGRFGPGDDVTIAQALKMAVIASGYDTSLYASHCADVTWTNACTHWSAGYVGTAEALDFSIPNRGINLDRPATRAEVASIVADAFKVYVVQSDLPEYTDVGPSTPYAAEIAALTRDGIVSGDDASVRCMNGRCLKTFRPGESVNRAEAVKMVLVAQAKYGSVGSQAAADESDSLVVTFNGESFSPAVLHILEGQTVTFKNQSNVSLRLASDPHPEHTDYLPLNAPSILNRWDSFEVSFPTGGTYGYHNHLNPTMRGTIVVDW